jgi:hypothetical protein
MSRRGVSVGRWWLPAVVAALAALGGCVFDRITLPLADDQVVVHGVLNPEHQPAAPQPAHLRRAGVMTSEALTRHVDKVRAQLEQSIAQGAPSGSGLTRIDMPAAELDDPIEPKTAFEPYRRFYAAHQRQMEVSVQTLRSQVRGQLNKGAPRLQQLATLDAAFENILSEREALVLGKVAKLFEKRFTQALRKHIHQLSNAQAEATADGADGADGAEAPSATAVSPLPWLLPLHQAMRTALPSANASDHDSPLPIKW